MFSAKRHTLSLLATLATLSWTTSVIAADASSASALPPVAGVAPSTAAPSCVPAAVPESTAARHNPFGSKPMAPAALAARRGGDGSVFNDAQLKGVVANNQVSNSSTGLNVISDGAFAGSAGLSTVIQNSGNNVLIQNATIVNVQLK